MGKPKTYENPPNTYWTLDDLKLSASERAGIEAHLDAFTVEGKVRIQDNDISYRILHEKRSIWGWVIEITASSPDAKAHVYSEVKSLFGGRDTRIADREYLNPHGNPSAREIIGMVQHYPEKGLGEPTINSIRFLAVPAGTYKKAAATGLKLQEVKENE